MSGAATCWEEAYRAQVEAIKELRAENAALRAKLDDPARLHAHCVRYLTDAQVAHLFGERMTAIQNDRDRLQTENAALRAELKIMEHRVITCGVAATHPDINLTLGYPKEWDSQQAEQVRSLRAENVALREKARLWEEICYGLGAPHYILDPYLRASKFREALRSYSVAIGKTGSAFGLVRKEAQP